jgi:hypothetical protein
MGKKKKYKNVKKENIPVAQSTSSKYLLPYIVMGCVILLVCVVRLRLLDIPLERDEGGYAYMGRMLLNGILPYSEVYDLKPPGTFFVYALILSIFGQTHTGIHLALLFVNIATSILLFLISRRLFNDTAGIVTGSSFLLMTLSPAVHGFWANTEHFILLSAMGGILLMLSAIERDDKKRLFLSGLLLGVSFLIKQHGIFFILFGLIYICRAYLKKRPLHLRDFFLKTGVFIIGIITPYTLTVMLFLIAGNLSKFWFWTFEYASQYASTLTVSQGMKYFKTGATRIIRPNILILLMAVTGLIGIIRDKSIRSNQFFVYGFLFVSFLSILPGLHFLAHYFILLIPAVSLLTGIGVYYIMERLQPYKIPAVVTAFIIVIPLIYPVIVQKDFFFKLSPVEVCRAIYGMSPFPESLEVAKYIDKNTDEKDRILVLGSEPQIYFYSKRRSATGYIYMYPLMGPHKFAAKMQEEMISEIESSMPKYTIFVFVSTSWLIRPDSEKLLLSYIQNHLKKYEQCGIVDIVSPESTIYKWDDDAVSYSPRSLFYISVLRKKI